MTIDVAPVTFRAFALQRGQRTELVNGRWYRVSTDHSGRSVIGPVRHRKHRGMLMSTGDPNGPTMFIPEIRLPRVSLPPSPPQKPGRWQRVKDRLSSAWFHLTNPGWHKLVQHVAVDVIVWALAVGVVGLVARVLLWAWS